jgi:hypothetical protein
VISDHKNRNGIFFGYRSSFLLLNCNLFYQQCDLTTSSDLLCFKYKFPLGDNTLAKARGNHLRRATSMAFFNSSKDSSPILSTTFNNLLEEIDLACDNIAAVLKLPACTTILK